MTRGDLTLIVFILALLHTIFFRIKIKCSKCGKITKTTTYTQLGATWLFIGGAHVAYDFWQGETINPYFDLWFLAPAFYYLFSEPKIFCRHCLVGVPFNKKDLIK
ncbi:hypothetical protein [Maridesulfovibrio sp.]|uniref:hypothetical protein n=1 Tax=Maridesulfovibrio sp. TaxID=2795000 RepID=UPI002A18974C|nr:hypothetical protein [Maridesulfovibrio sp.]